MRLHDGMHNSRVVLQSSAHICSIVPSSAARDGTRNKKDGASSAPSFVLQIANALMRERSRAGMPIAVIAHIGSRARIVGTVGLHAIGGGVVAAVGRRCTRPRAAAIIIILVIIGGAGSVVARAAVIA